MAMVDVDKQPNERALSFHTRYISSSSQIIPSWPALVLQHPFPYLSRALIARQSARRFLDLAHTPRCITRETSGCDRWVPKWKANSWVLCPFANFSTFSCLSAAPLLCAGPKTGCQCLKRSESRRRRNRCISHWYATQI